jgi:hypothetical protein
MYTFETLVDTYTKSATQILGYVQPETVRKSLIDLTETQAGFAKTVAKQLQTMSETAVSALQNTAKTDWTKSFFAK